MEDQVARHYGRSDLGDAIMTALQATIGEGRAPTIDDLAPVDEFHIGGRRASARLFDQLYLRPGAEVLDVGAGIGGTARYVAQTYGCKVTGIDLTPEYCEVAATLTSLVGLGDRVAVRQASALDMPFAGASFDAAYMVHVGMNIDDKAALVSEVHRVLRPGGTFAVYDVFRGAADGELKYPVPWAGTPETSFLVSPDDLQSQIRQAGFTIESSTDRTDFAIEFFEAAVAASSKASPPPLGLHLLMGSDAREKFGNMMSNVSNRLCGPWEIIASKPA